MLKPNPYGAALRLAIRNTLTPDPYTVVPAPEVVEAFALTLELMGATSNARRPDRAANPWLLELPRVQLEHAAAHCAEALASDGNGAPNEHKVDRETGLPHIGHALVRLAFTHALLLGVGSLDRSCSNCGDKHPMTSACWTTCPCDGCKNFSNWVPKNGG